MVKMIVGAFQRAEGLRISKRIAYQVEGRKCAQAEVGLCL